MSRMSDATSSRVWSCATLREGLEHVVRAADETGVDEEDELEKYIQELLGLQALNSSSMILTL